MAFQKNSNNSGRGFFTDAGQRAKVTLLFAAAQVIYSLGRILDRPTAEKIASGGSHTETEYVNANGVSFPIANGTVSLSNLKDWACPVCGSAHGTAVGASNQGPTSEPTVKGLMSNKWFYNPRTEKIFVISNTCYDKYIAVDYKSRIVDVDEILPSQEEEELA